MKRTVCAILAALLMVPWAVVTSLGTEVPENDFHTEEMYEYIMRSGEDLNAVFDYVHGELERSIPDPIMLKFWDDGIPDSEWYVLQKSATPDFAECETITDVPFKEYEYFNALLGEHFYWRAAADLDSIADSPVHEMTVTTLTPRVCYVPGGTNVRDIGGYASSLVEGGKIRQGLYYRGAWLNYLTDEGLAVMYDKLGIRAEIDLRDADRGRPYLRGFDRIAYYNAPISNGDYFTDFHDQFKLVFEVIANAAEAPVYLHCQAGADRTGISTYMLLTVCGVDYQDVALDYMFTNFSVMGERTLDTPQSYFNRLNDYPGETKAEQAKSWIMSQGVSEETVERIRETFVEGYESEYLKKLVKEARLDGETVEYKAGDAPKFTGVVPQGAEYALGTLEWIGSDGTSFTSDSEKNAALEAEGKLFTAFKRGVKYRLAVTFDLGDESDLAFSEEMTVIINGEEYDNAGPSLSGDAKSALFVKSFALTDKDLTGDVNCDGKVNSKDVIFLMKAIVKDGGYDVALDVNGDEKVNSKDVIALMKQIVGIK